MANKVLILTGPGGAGKTTIANLLAVRRGFILLDGDKIDSEFFPEGKHWLPENLAKLGRAHDEIFKQTRGLFLAGKNVVVDYIIFGDYLEFFAKFKKEFGDNLIVKVLFPSEKETIIRDKERECWTTGIDRIKAVRQEFIEIRDKIGIENFLDTTKQTVEETFNKYFSG